MAALLLLAVALGLDNLAAAIGFGVGTTGRVSGATRLRIAVVFGLFEAGMPVLGLVLGHGLADSIGEAARWLGGAALIAFGVAGLVQARREAGHPGPEDGERAQPPQRNRVQPIGRLLLAGLLLSGDNLAAGFALGAYQVSIAAAAVVFGTVSVVMSLAGLELGARIGAAAGERSELIACVLLIVVGAVIAAGVL
ncbi:MAG TPA: manganese efflux pump [Streptosporangiaceae bacterium]